MEREIQRARDNAKRNAEEERPEPARRNQLRGKRWVLDTGSYIDRDDSCRVENRRKWSILPSWVGRPQNTHARRKCSRERSEIRTSVENFTEDKDKDETEDKDRWKQRHGVACGKTGHTCGGANVKELSTSLVVVGGSQGKWSKENSKTGSCPRAGTSLDASVVREREAYPVVGK